MHLPAGGSPTKVIFPEAFPQPRLGMRHSLPRRVSRKAYLNNQRLTSGTKVLLDNIGMDGEHKRDWISIYWVGALSSPLIFMWFSLFLSFFLSSMYLRKTPKMDRLGELG